MVVGNSLMVQWVRLCTSNAGGADSISGQGTKISLAMRHNQKIKNKRLRCRMKKSEISEKYQQAN